MFDQRLIHALADRKHAYGRLSELRLNLVPISGHDSPLILLPGILFVQAFGK
jgi:hypothetical protein